MRESLGILMQRSPSSLDYTLPTSLQRVCVCCQFAMLMPYCFQVCLFLPILRQSDMYMYIRASLVPTSYWGSSTGYQIIFVLSEFKLSLCTSAGIWTRGCGSNTRLPLLDSVYRQPSRHAATGCDGWDRLEENYSCCQSHSYTGEHITAWPKSDVY